MNAHSAWANGRKTFIGDEQMKYSKRFASGLATILMASFSVASLAAETSAVGASRDTLEEVVVTGSRVITNGNDSPTPVTVLNIQEMEAVRPGSVADQLNDMPQFFNSQGQQNPIGNGGSTGGNPNGNGNVLNLRNFGTNRTLILADGHRVAPNSANGTVDIDMIPQLLLRRVDVVTGGASAVYGADAVTGVVNFVTDTKFTGWKINGQAGLSARNDDPTRAIGVAWGANLAGGRGHFEASYEFRGDAGASARSARNWGLTRWLSVPVNPTAGTVQTNYLAPNGSRQDASFGGTISTITVNPLTGQASPANPLNNYYFISPGVLAQVYNGVPIPNSRDARAGSGGSGSYFDQSLKGKLNMHQLFARFDYDFADSLHGYVKVSGTSTYNQGYGISQPMNQGSNQSAFHAIFVSNPYLPAQYAAQMQTAGVTVFGLNKAFSGPGMDQYRLNAEVFGTNYALDTGLTGSFGAGWKWDLALVYGANKQRSGAGIFNELRQAAALDAVRDPANPSNIVCWVSTQAQYATKYPGCVPFSTVFGTTLAPQDAAYLTDHLEQVTKTNMVDVEAALSGTLFNDWAGPVNVALSAQARKLGYEVTPNFTAATLTNPLDCSGLRLLVCNATSIAHFQGESLPRSRITNDVKEAALEFNLPLLKDVFMARDVSFNGAYRYTNYSTSGSISSWKGGVDWKFADALSFRGTRSRDIRAPTLNELYAPTALGTFSGLDNLINSNLDGAGGRPNPAGAYTQGNSTLKPELADTTTLGLVYRPTWAQGLSVAIDYYNIDVKNAIVTVAGNNTTTQQGCISSGGTSPLCALLVRPINCCTNTTFANALTAVYTQPINLSNQYTDGLDLEVNYSGHLYAMPVNLRLLGSYQPDNVYVDPVTQKHTNYAGSASGGGPSAGNPTRRASFIGTIEPIPNLKVSVMERWRAGLNWFPQESGPGAITYTMLNAADHVSPMFVTNLNLGYSFEKFAGKTEIYLNIQNLFDRAPSIYVNPTLGPFAGLQGVAPGDDALGRFYTVGFRYRR
jgi:outer membrane receptor protein involved in Fe transport